MSNGSEREPEYKADVERYRARVIGVSSTAWRVGERRVLAVTCRSCGQLKDGNAFPRYRRKPHERPYLSRRCVRCWWRHMERSAGR